MAGVVGALLS